jgi:hypothetical protein
MLTFKEFLKQNDPSLEENWAEKAGAFGRGFAKTATGGAYQNVRAAGDYVVKTGLKKLGIRGGEDTTYDRELKQEKEKLDKDSKEQPAASAAGDIVGHAVPYVPVVGAMIQSGKNALNTIKSYRDKASPIADKIQRAAKTP